MDFLRRAILWVLVRLRHALNSFVYRGKRVYAFSGLRRSGNHACINWLADCVEGQTATFRTVGLGNGLKVSERIVHINDINWSDTFTYLRRIVDAYPYIRQAEIVFVSMEDYRPTFPDRFVPAGATRIAINRSLLNLIASRVKHAVTQARQGLGRGDMLITDKFFDLYRWTTTAEKEGAYLWEYERWLGNEENFRSRFLERLGLSEPEDAEDRVTVQGGGSSFSSNNLGEIKQNALKRWQMIEWNSRLVEIIDSKGLDLLSGSERSAFAEMKAQAMSNSE